MFTTKEVWLRQVTGCLGPGMTQYRERAQRDPSMTHVRVFGHACARNSESRTQPGQRHTQKGGKPPNVGGCTLETCPRNCNMNHAAKETAQSWSLAHPEPRMGSGGGKPPQNGPARAAEGPVIQAHRGCHLHPARRGKCIGPTGHAHHKGVWRRLGSFWAGFGLFWPIADPRGPVWVILNSNMATGRSLRGVWDPRFVWVRWSCVGVPSAQVLGLSGPSYLSY